MARNVRGIFVVGVIGIGSLLTGCSSWSKSQERMLLWNYPHAEGVTLAETSDEHRQRVSRVIARDNLALVEDLDLLFLTDRPTRLTRWHSR